MSRFGYEATVPRDSSDDGLRLRRRVFEFLAAAHKGLSMRYDRFVLRNRKELAGSNLVG